MQPLSGQQGAQGGTPTLGFEKRVVASGAEIVAEEQQRNLLASPPRIKFGFYAAEKAQMLAELRGALTIAELACDTDRCGDLLEKIEKLEAHRVDLPVYYVYPMSETQVNRLDGTQTVVALNPDPGPEFVRVRPHPDRGNNPNVFIRRDDPLAHLAEVLP
jgi:hypothetical protein